MANNQQLLLGEGAGSAPAVYIEDVFSTYLYTGNGSTQTITTGIDLSTKGGMIWFKERASQGFSHALIDTARGNSSPTEALSLASDNTNSQSSVAAVPTSSGFSLSGPGSAGPVNYNGSTYASWTFRKQPKFFDVVTYTGNDTSRSISHSLGSVPGCIIIKNVSAGGFDWVVYHRSNSATAFLKLNTTAAVATNATYFSSAPTSTVFNIGAGGLVNNGTDTYVAYLFAHDAGGFGAAGSDNVISCGSWSTTLIGGRYDALIDIGFEPQFLIFKPTNNTGNWQMYDSMRGLTANAVGSNNSKRLYPSLSNAEDTDTTTQVQYTGSGKILYGVDALGYSGIYIAIRRGPMKVPTVGTSVFSPVYRQGTSTVVQVPTGFVTDLGITQSTQNGYSTGGAVFYDRLRGRTLFLSPSGSSAEDTYTTLVQGFDTQSGVIMAADTSRAWTNFLGSPPNDNYEFYANWFFKRAPGFFDEVCYTGDGGSPQVITHNLTVVPEMIIVKARSIGYQWIAYHSGLGTGSYIQLDSTAASVAYAAFPAVSTTTFSANSTYNRASGQTYVAYLFATCAGVSKVGSYTGTGTTLQIDCGFTAGARWVMIKRTDSTGNWFVWDSARGIVAGNDPYLVLNTTNAQVANTDYIDTYNAGFEISSTAPAAINASAGTFIFLAIA